MIRFYFNGSPNPTKVALLLEETGLPYEPVAIDTRTGAQFAPEFLAINPNGKVPAITDGDAVVFDSNAILLYLAEKTGQFLPPTGDAKARGELLSWLMFVATGIGPFFGQAVHFKHFAPEPVPYAHERYQYEADRHLKVVEGHLASRDWMVGNAYSIVDMALWGWVRMLPFVLGEGAFDRYPNVKRLCDAVSARPAAARAVALKDRFTFKAQMDDEARKVMFGHLKKAG
jgi:GST-like protein